MKRLSVAALALLLALGACGTRSISNSGYPGDSYYGAAGNAFYQGEIDELDLFVPQKKNVSFQADIATALDVKDPVQAALGQPLLVVQSGAPVPDEPMTDALASYFQVAPFSGVPPRLTNAATDKDGSYGERLRLAAAAGGFRHMVVYWGQLESLSTNGVTKAVSWVPIVGMVIPDESQQMRIRLKAAVIEVATGRWRMVLADSIENSAISASINRATSDQEQVAELKAAGYAKLAQLIAGQTSAN
jgi:hypothetical protein